MYDDNWDPNQPIICPYDETHVISAKRFQRHIIKCRQNHPHLDLVTCPFNAVHSFLRSERQLHLATCPDRTPLDCDKVRERCPETGEIFVLKGNTTMPDACPSIPDCAEDWDQEIEEHVAAVADYREIYLRDQGFLPPKPEGLRKPNISSLPSSVQNNINDDASSIASDTSKTSSIYVDPVTPHASFGGTKNQKRPVKGRGVIQNLSKQTVNRIGMRNEGGVNDDAHSLVSDNNRSSFGRGRITQTLLKFQS